MIQANDLRIGNLVNYHTEQMDIIAQPINVGQIKWAEDDIEFFNLVHSPIPITDEWLLRMGFEKLPHSFTCDIFHLTEWDDYPLNWCVAMNKNNAVIVLKLKYIHQLQNFYHALTGEELTIKL